MSEHIHVELSTAHMNISNKEVGVTRLQIEQEGRFRQDNRIEAPHWNADACESPFNAQLSVAIFSLNSWEVVLFLQIPEVAQRISRDSFPESTHKSLTKYGLLEYPISRSKNTPPIPSSENSPVSFRHNVATTPTHIPKTMVSNTRQGDGRKKKSNSKPTPKKFLIWHVGCFRGCSSGATAILRSYRRPLRKIQNGRHRNESTMVPNKNTAGIHADENTEWVPASHLRLLHNVMSQMVISVQLTSDVEFMSLPQLTSWKLILAFPRRFRQLLPSFKVIALVGNKTRMLSLVGNVGRNSFTLVPNNVELIWFNI